MKALRPSEVSVIIPAWNEARTIAGTLGHLLKTGVPGEIIVVDGGSEDGTLEEVKRLPDTEETKLYAIRSPKRGRGAQMNYGASAARGEVLLFLHADTRPSPGWDLAALETLSREGVVAGYFGYAVDGIGLSLRILELGTNLRVALLDLPYGDQGLFLRRADFEVIGGFYERPLMEDVDILQRLRRRGAVRQAPAVAITSARRFEREGTWRMVAKDTLLLAGFRAGVPPELLSRFYRFGNR